MKLLTLNSLARTDLELPLGGHDLRVGTGDLDTRVQACLEMGLDNISAEDLASAHTTVVRALGAGEPSNGPAVWPVIHIEKGVFLLEAEPGLLLLVGLGELVALVAVVVGVRGAISVPALTDHQDVRGQAERVGEDRHRAQVDVGVVARCLAGGGTVEVPLGQVLERELAAGGDLGEGLGIGSACVVG